MNNRLRQFLFWRTAFFLALVVIMVLALLPMDGSEGFSGQDKLIHLFTFSVLFVLGSRAFAGQLRPTGISVVFLYLGLLCYGIVMEWLQGQTTYRSMEGWDLVADLAGLIVGHLVLLVFPSAAPGGPTDA